jgi:hypothetical protein
MTYCTMYIVCSAKYNVHATLSSTLPSPLKKGDKQIEIKKIH